MSRLLLPILLFLSLPAVANVQTLVGTAVDTKSGETVYTETHRFIERNGQRVMQSTYTTPERQTLAQREVVYQGDKVTRYQLNQPDALLAELIERDLDSLKIKVDGKKSRAKTVNARRSDEVVIDAGFSNFIVRNWDQLASGEPQKFYFASTAQLDLVRLQVKKTKRQPEDAEFVLFEMTAANPLIRALMTPIKVGYYPEQKQLAYYRGISNLRDEKGETFDVEITFPRVSESENLAQVTP